MHQNTGCVDVHVQVCTGLYLTCAISECQASEN